MARTGRRPGPSRTRTQLLAAAASCFAAAGYDATSLRRVAADAGVDPALVRRFFGGKEQLFTEMASVLIDPERALAAVTEGPPAAAGERLLRYFLDLLGEVGQPGPYLGPARAPRGPGGEPAGRPGGRTVRRPARPAHRRRCRRAGAVGRAGPAVLPHRIRTCAEGGAVMNGCTRPHVLVTGASSGIGRATVERLAADGYHVYAGVRRPADGAALQQAARAAAAPGEVTPLLLDVTDQAQIAAAAQAVIGHVGAAGLAG